MIEKKAEKNSEIAKVQQRVMLCEEKVAKFGGGYYEKREHLKEEKSQLTAELQAVEKEIKKRRGGTGRRSLLTGTGGGIGYYNKYFGGIE